MARKKKKKSKSKKKGAARKKGRRKGKKKTKRRSNLMPIEVIKKHAKKLKRNKRAADIYRDVLKCK